ncbi:putative Xre family transcriptional regulator [Selenomonas ruminantium subsp. lactilytica TAM6421]|uniref:Putative Xre family transcriptional regulator n=1 Tax=Selenomonas ruminantium subsp. lactilytica (strain NBRC 103574 / TAM6421) TaxID=927704 RepID=I0GQB5_SELRL|nr:helix-turn-helix domain-containing protein [Selenomonas ruminantium]BAL82952.1 putative Xre family transcriptional regulator [Selenomonas ruminantium subsp. lactilytica TAM6421]
MDQYVTGSIIKRLRESRKMTQLQLAEALNVSDKTISKWENGRGYPDIALLEPLAKTLRLSVSELLAGESISNTNRCFNMKKIKFYVCPICGNVIITTGRAAISCCGIMLPDLEPETADSTHTVHVEQVEDEYYVAIDHEMGKKHYISFVVAVKEDGYDLKKFYPEGAAEARFKRSNVRNLYYYCNQHGLFQIPLGSVKSR